MSNLNNYQNPNSFSYNSKFDNIYNNPSTVTYESNNNTFTYKYNDNLIPTVETQINFDSKKEILKNPQFKNTSEDNNDLLNYQPNFENERYLNNIYLNDMKHTIENNRVAKFKQRQKEIEEDNKRIDIEQIKQQEKNNLIQTKKFQNAKETMKYYNDYVEKSGQNKFNNRFVQHNKEKQQERSLGATLITNPDIKHLKYKFNFLKSGINDISKKDFSDNNFDQSNNRNASNEDVKELKNSSSGTFEKHFFSKFGKPHIYNQQTENKDFIYYKNKDLGYNGELYYRKSNLTDLEGNNINSYNKSNLTNENNAHKNNFNNPADLKNSYDNNYIVDIIRNKYNNKESTFNSKMKSSFDKSNFNIVLHTQNNLNKNKTNTDSTSRPISRNEITYDQAKSNPTLHSKFKKIQDQILMRQILDKQTGKIPDTSINKNGYQYIPYFQGNFNQLIYFFILFLYCRILLESYYFNK